MKKLVLFIMGLVCATAIMHAQSPPEIRPLHIGDTVPDVLFRQIMNYPARTANLSDFTKNKKLLILDFWSTGCSGCIGYFPHMQKLADKFKDDLQIILVDGKTKLWHDDKTKIERVLKNVKDKSSINVQLPIVLNCDILDQYFPRQTIPHEVWLNNKGRVIAITGAEEVNKSNIQKFLSGEKLSLHLKEDVRLDLSRNSLLEIFRGTDSASWNPISHFIIIKGIINGLGSGSGVRRSKQGDHLYTGLYYTNLPLLDIYQAVYRSQMNCPRNRIIVETSNPERFSYARNDTSEATLNVYSYDETLPPCITSELLEKAREDLASTFHTRVTNEKRIINCFILKTTSRIHQSLSKGEKQAYIMDRLDKQKYIRNMSVTELVTILNLNIFDAPLIDETGLKQPINLDYPYKVISQANMIKALQKAGFQVIKTKRLLDVVVISDKNQNSNKPFKPNT